MKVLVTGAAGFIGFHLSKRLLDDGHTVDGLDVINDYYSPELKHDRLRLLKPYPEFRHLCFDMAESELVNKAFSQGDYTHVVNLAAQAGVRYSLQNPRAYVDTNLVGFFNILEACKQHAVEHFVYASSSSVYGLNTSMPFSVHDNVDHPISIYAASKKSNELMAHCYSHLFNLPTTGLRFFTVYGPWGRPDMALFLFTKAILENKPIDVFNNGKMKRDFTYIDDIVEGIVRVLKNTAKPNAQWDSTSPDPATSPAPYRIYNIGNNNTVELLDYIRVLEETIGKKATMNMLPMQPGDVAATFANVDALVDDVAYKPNTPITTGIANFVEWYRSYYKV